jgi:hypothetical protein
MMAQSVFIAVFLSKCILDLSPGGYGKRLKTMKTFAKDFSRPDVM